MDNKVIDELIKEREKDFETVHEQEELELDESQSRKLFGKPKIFQFVNLLQCLTMVT
jgi:hypothetical protein